MLHSRDKEKATQRANVAENGLLDIDSLSLVMEEKSRLKSAKVTWPESDRVRCRHVFH